MDYISREEAITAAIDGADKWNGGLREFRNEHISAAMLAIPAADVRPVVRGTWGFKWDAEKDPKKYFTRIVCSNCGLLTGQVSNFCPNCGAMMGIKGEDDV